MTMDSGEFRKVLGNFATGVTVITVPIDGGVHGMTANAFTSVSLDPPLVLVSVDKKAHMHGFLQEAGLFGVNFLRAGQQNWSNHFAGKRDPSVEAELEYDWLENVPVLKGSLAHLVCRLWSAYDGGDHTLYIGEVMSLQAGDGDPLLYFRSAYRFLAP